MLLIPHHTTHLTPCFLALTPPSVGARRSLQPPPPGLVQRSHHSLATLCPRHATTREPSQCLCSNSPMLLDLFLFHVVVSKSGTTCTNCPAHSPWARLGTRLALSQTRKADRLLSSVAAILRAALSKQCLRFSGDAGGSTARSSREKQDRTRCANSLIDSCRLNKYMLVLHWRLIISFNIISTEHYTQEVTESLDLRDQNSKAPITASKPLSTSLAQQVPHPVFQIHISLQHALSNTHPLDHPVLGPQHDRAAPVRA